MDELKFSHTPEDFILAMLEHQYNYLDCECDRKASLIRRLKDELIVDRAKIAKLKQILYVAKTKDQSVPLPMSKFLYIEQEEKEEWRSNSRRLASN